MRKYTHNNNELTLKNLNEEVCLKGWVSKRRNLGGLVFVDLRDRFGITQLVIKPDNPNYNDALTLKNEYVIEVKGKVVERESKNKELQTGDIEVVVSKLTILNVAEQPPIAVSYDDNSLEDTRLKYRYLDLRRPKQQHYLMRRSSITQTIRNYLISKGFYELDTPILGKSTPEGARDFLVPSRLYHGSYYALPQSPQIYKQLFMVAGFEKYFQIAKCFRDEDLRSDRQLEFTQVDIEASFVEEEDIRDLIEGLFVDLFKKEMNITLTRPFKKLTFKEAMDLYGSDKPDLRYGLTLKDPKTSLAFIPFLEDKVVRYIKVEGGANFTRRELDALTDEAKKNHGEGLAFLKYQEGKLTGSISKFFEDNDYIKEYELANDDLLLFVFGKDYLNVSNALGAVRRSVARSLDLVKDDEYAFLWVVDFPLFEYDEEEKRFVARHHPFTSPKHKDDLDGNLEEVLAKAYDIVLNGYEIGGGSIRIHNSTLQQKMFKALGLDKETVNQRFGFLIEALSYGTPPHGGIALGLDRIIMLMTHTANIKDVIAFPKTQSARDLMMNAPDKVDLVQEIELGLKKKEEK
ncbi:MAG TPA: aspartate--tRNA ligase [Acholeplasma sp.]|jgi:aspartyl-tRNA synthetase|nr:aspartate--tRNA ligase [Acholeplasma sp.]